MKNKSLEIILLQYKKEHINEKEAIQLISDLYQQTYYYPWWTSSPYTTTDIRYNEPQTQKFEITCKDG